MSVWLFEDLGLQNSKKDFPRYCKLLENTVGNLGGDLYIPMMYFRAMKELQSRHECEHYSNKLEELRSLIFAVRDEIKICKAVDDLIKGSSRWAETLKKVHEEMIFFFAVIQDADAWLGSTSIHKAISGPFNGWSNEFLYLISMVSRIPDHPTPDQTD